MADFKYIKQPISGNLANFTDAEFRKIENALSNLTAPPVWTAATMLNAWVSYGVAYHPAGYYKDAFGRVSVRGLVKNGAMGAAVFNLPQDMWPSKDMLFAACSTNAAAHEVYVALYVLSATGAVIPFTSGGPALNTYVSLNFSFLVGA